MRNGAYLVGSDHQSLSLGLARSCPLHLIPAPCQPVVSLAQPRVLWQFCLSDGAASFVYCCHQGHLSAL